MLEALIPVFGVGKGDGFSLEQLMQFVGKAFGNSNADVRAAATRVTVLVRLLLFLFMTPLCSESASVKICICCDTWNAEQALAQHPLGAHAKGTRVLKSD